MITRAFRDLWSLLMFFKFSKLHEPQPIALVPINHETHSRSYDFLYLMF